MATHWLSFANTFPVAESTIVMEMTSFITRRRFEPAVRRRPSFSCIAPTSTGDSEAARDNRSATFASMLSTVFLVFLDAAAMPSTAAPLRGPHGRAQRDALANRTPWQIDAVCI
jgi:p-aminobenzoyl-glutamate transporter AbgT